MPTFDVEFEVFCSCGEGLCNQSVATSAPRGLYVTVEPCEKCKTASYDQGYEDAEKKLIMNERR